MKIFVTGATGYIGAIIKKVIAGTTPIMTKPAYLVNNTWRMVPSSPEYFL